MQNKVSSSAATAAPSPHLDSRANSWIGTSDLLSRCDGVIHGFLGGLPRMDEQEQAATVLPIVARSRWAPSTLLLMTQPHGRAILEVTTAASVPGPVETLIAPDVDGAELAAPSGAVILVKSADCVPILAVDPELGRSAGLHAGWRGVAAGILPHLLERWRQRGSSLRSVRLAFGPHIRQCCFQVQQDCVDQFVPDDLPGAREERAGSTYLALEAVLRTQAARFGIASSQIDALPQCTDCHRGADGSAPFASYRRANRSGAQAGRNLSYIALTAAAVSPR